MALNMKEYYSVRQTLQLAPSCFESEFVVRGVAETTPSSGTEQHLAPHRASIYASSNQSWLLGAHYPCALRYQSTSCRLPRAHHPRGRHTHLHVGHTYIGIEQRCRAWEWTTPRSRCGPYNWGYSAACPSWHVLHASLPAQHHTMYNGGYSAACMSMCCMHPCPHHAMYNGGYSVGCHCAACIPVPTTPGSACAPGRERLHPVLEGLAVQDTVREARM